MSTWFAIVLAFGCAWVILGLALSYKFLLVLPEIDRRVRLWQYALWWMVGPILAPIAIPLLHYLERRDRLPKTWDFFLSYSHWDCLWASALFGIVRFSGGRVFLDYVAIQRGADWREPAETGIRQSDIVLYIDSVDSRASENVQHELEYRTTTYAKTSQSWRDKEVADSRFPARSAKAGYWFQRETGVVGLQIPPSPHTSAKYATPHGAASESIGNIEDWLAVNLPAVEACAQQLGLPCPPPRVLDTLMRQYLEWVAGERPLQDLLSGMN